MVFQDISRLFPSIEAADSAFGLFDRDGNGDISLEEIEHACRSVAILLLPCFAHGLRYVSVSFTGNNCHSSILCVISIALWVVWIASL